MGEGLIHLPALMEKSFKIQERSLPVNAELDHLGKVTDSACYPLFPSGVGAG